MNAKDRLSDYREKRDVRKTAEPSAKGAEGSGRPRFVIQEHAASSHHFDLRLEVDGVLVSFAVPKGPSTDPRKRRLAIRTEDHPLDCADFEGTIPEGEYGAGRVIVWDRGPYENLRAEKEGDGADMAGSIEEGKVEVRLRGQKLSGGYALIRTSKDDERERWLLVKKDDEGADARRKPTKTEPESVTTGRTLEDLEETEEE